jgi:tetratricopeptide (TPR) repeat protein
LWACRVLVAALSLTCVSHAAAQTSEAGPPPAPQQEPAAPLALPVAVDPPPAPPAVRQGAIQPGAAAAMQNCDGHGDVQGSGDGMTQQGLNIWSVGGDRIRRRPTFSHGVEYCTRALARIDGEFPQHWMRRVSLLQARALHRLLVDDHAGAAVDLDAAAAGATAGDAYFQRSLGFNAGVIRAFGLVKAGDRTGGEALAMEMHARRPYSREAVNAVLLAVGPDAEPRHIETLLRAAGRLDPSRSRALYTYLFESGRYEDALRAYGELKSPRPIYDQTYDLRTQIQNHQQRRVIDEIFWQHSLGMRAFALAALNCTEEARAALNEAQTRLAAATPPPEPLPPPRRTSNEDIIRHTVHEQTNLEIESRAPPIREGWAALVEARIAAGEGRVEDARAAIRDKRLPTSAALIDLAHALDPTSERRPASAALLGLPAHDERLLFMQLVDAETARRIEGGVSVLDRAFVSSDFDWRGGCEENNRNRVDGLIAVCAASRDATPQVTEERALLRAATRAMDAGHTHFVIDSRLDIHHTIVSTMYGVPMNQSQGGFESRLDVRFMSGPPDDCWRCFDAAEVRAQLQPIYGEVPPAPQRRQRRER